MSGSVREGGFYAVQNSTLDGKPIKEGVAQVMEVIDPKPDPLGRIHCEVLFPGLGERPTERWVYPNDKVK